MKTGSPVVQTSRKQDEKIQTPVALFDPGRTSTWEIIDRARRLREQRFGNHVALCSVINAKSGGCTEDCAFCSQSGHHRCEIPVYPLVTVGEALSAARQAESIGARCFGIVTSGRSISSKKDRARILKIVETIRDKTAIGVAASLGLAAPGFLRELKTAGLSTYHHNLETAPSRYREVCTTHSLEDRIRTIQAAKEVGLRVCSGGIFGLGEGPAERAEFAMLLNRLGVDRIPVNFLNPIPGTPLEDNPRLEPTEALHIVAAMRVSLPDREILVCGGREATLRSLQPLLFLSGANGMMTGRYLTTTGQGVDADHAMLTDLRLNWRPFASEDNRRASPAGPYPRDGVDS